MEIRNGEEPLCMMTLYEELDDIRLIPLEFKSNKEKSVKATYVTTKIDSNVKKLLSALGVKNSMHPEKLSFSRRNIKGDVQQMMPDLGVEHLIYHNCRSKIYDILSQSSVVDTTLEECHFYFLTVLVIDFCRCQTQFHKGIRQ